MILLAKLISIAITLIGCVVLMKNDVITKMITWVKEGNNVYYVGLCRIVCGFILFKASFASRTGWIVLVFSLLFIGSGITVFVLKKGRALALTEKILGKISDATFKLLGSIPMLIGVLLLCAI